MHTMHPTLLIGPYDWEPQLIPETEFHDRIQSFWEKFPDQDIAGAIVYGDSREHSALMYLSHFLPKLGPALMLLPRVGAPTLLVSGAPNMLAAARRMTWVEKTMAMRDPAGTVRQWLGALESLEISASQPRAVVIGAESMPSALYKPLCEVMGARAFHPDAPLLLQEIMRRKRPVELLLIRQGCAILTAATAALTDAKAAGANISAAILAAEQVARRAGAQDVRVLFSLDGGRTLRPFERLVDTVAEPLQVYLAVRYAGTWLDGFVHMSASPQPVAARAAAALAAIIASARAGVKWRDLSRLALERIQPYGAHAVFGAGVGHSIGLSLAGASNSPADGEESLLAGGVYALWVGASDGSAIHVILSALVHVRGRDNELLWSAV